MKEKISLYSKKYPTHLSSSRLLWIVNDGDTLNYNGKLYTVCQVLRPKIKGATPNIVIEESS